MAALECAPAIRVSAVAPGVILPAESRTPEYLAWRADVIPLKRQGTPSDVCAAVLYLLQSPIVTGQILVADGGESIAHDGRHAANVPTDPGV
jgi:NAD(P)-dependent dehydrogenase (short-subunit alcohol dehydrogenase family)